MILAPRLSTSGKGKGFPEECSNSTVGMGNSTFTSTHSLGVAVRGPAGLGRKSSHLKTPNFGPPTPLPAPSMILLPHSAFPFSAEGVLPRGSAPLHCPPYHLSGEQSPGSKMPGPREPSQHPGETTQRRLLDMPTRWNKGHMFDFCLSSLHPHIGIPVVVDRTTKHRHHVFPFVPLPS